MLFGMVEIHAFALGPVIQGPLNICFRQVKVLGKLPKLCASALKGASEIIFGEILFRSPPIGSVFVALYELIGAVNLVKRTGSGMAKFVAADAPQKPCGVYFCKIQENCVISLITNGGTRLRTPGVGDYINLV